MIETEKENNQSRGILTISKDCLATLPIAEFPGEIILIDKKEDVAEAIEYLKKAPVIGFDTETRPSFKKGHSYKVSLIQLSTPERCYLFRTNLINVPDELKEILEDENLLKIGLSIHDDFHNLNKLINFTPGGFIDLQLFVKDYQIIDNSLSRLYGILFDKRISKAQRLSNWEADHLTEAQMKYAALDAFACIKIYEHLINGRLDFKNSKYLTFPKPENNREEKEKTV